MRRSPSASSCLALVFGSVSRICPGLAMRAERWWMGQPSQTPTGRTCCKPPASAMAAKCSSRRMEARFSGNVVLDQPGAPDTFALTGQGNGGAAGHTKGGAAREAGTLAMVGATGAMTGLSVEWLYRSGYPTTRAWGAVGWGQKAHPVRARVALCRSQTTLWRCLGCLD